MPLPAMRLRKLVFQDVKRFADCTEFVINTAATGIVDPTAVAEATWSRAARQEPSSWVEL